MSLSSLAPAEKTEHMIYSLLPISIATWTASLLNLSDPIQILVAIISISSFGTILLYELTPEQWAVNEIIRRRVRSRRSLKEAILVFSMMMQIWVTEPTRRTDWKNDYIEEQAKKQVSISVNRPYVTKRVWRIRASIYLIPSIWFIFNAFRNYLDILLGIEGSLSRLPDCVSWALSFLHLSMDWVILSVILLIILSGYVRHRKLPSRIDRLSRFNHLRRLLSLEKLRKPEYFDGEQQKSDYLGRSMVNYLTLVTELDSLMESLMANDWSFFIDGWDRIYRWVHRETVQLYEKYFQFDLMRPFADIYNEIRNKNSGNPVNIQDVTRNAKQRLDWVCYILTTCEMYKNQRIQSQTKRFRGFLRMSSDDRDILSLPEFETNLITLHTEVCKWTEDQMQDPKQLLNQASIFSTIKRDGVEAAIMSAIGNLTQATTHYLQGAEIGVKYLISEFDTEPPRTQYDLSILAKVILRSFQDDGVGFSIKVENHELFKNLKTYGPPEMHDQWVKAISKFLQTAEREPLRRLLEDHGFLSQYVETSTPIQNAFRDLKERYKDDNQIMNPLRRYKIQ